MQPIKRRPEAEEEEEPPRRLLQAAVLKKRCRSFDLEIRGCRHLQELAARCVRTLEAALESAINRIPEEVTKALTNFVHNPSICNTLSERNQPPRYKLRFTNGLSNEVFTKKGICDVNGEPLKISVDANYPQDAGSHRLFSAKIRVVVLDGDFNKNDQGCWTSEEFTNRIVRPRDKVGAVLTGELELSLKDGEAHIHDATFVDNSKFMRSGKFRLGVMAIDDLGERIQEGITEPFVVKDRRGEGSRKHEIPLLDDDVWRLKKISKDGVFHEALKKSGISNVKNFLRLYYTDEHALRKILIKATDKIWTTIVEHAKKCDPGRQLYSFMENNNVVLFLNSVCQIVGVKQGDQYIPFSELDRTLQDKVGQLRKSAYENVTQLIPINQCVFQESWMQEPKFSDQIQGHMDPNFADIIQEGTITTAVHGHKNFQPVAEKNVHEADDHEGSCSSHPMQCKFARIGSVRVRRLPSINENNEESFDISFLLDSGSEQFDANTAANDVSGSVTIHCPNTSANEITGSVVVRQASFKMDHPACDMLHFPENDASVPQLYQDQMMPQFDASFISLIADAPVYSTHNSFKDEECHETLQGPSED